MLALWCLRSRGKHRAGNKSRLLLRKRCEKHCFRGAKGDNEKMHDAYLAPRRGFFLMFFARLGRDDAFFFADDFRFPDGAVDFFPVGFFAEV